MPDQTIPTIVERKSSESSDMPASESLFSADGFGDDGGMNSIYEDEGSVRVVDSGSGRSLTAWVREVGEDVVVAVGGGERPHVGCVVLAVPTPGRGATGFAASCSVLTIPPHKEEPIARAVAECVCRRLGRVTVVTAGVHEDDIDLDGITTYLRLGDELAEAVTENLAEEPQPPLQ